MKDGFLHKEDYQQLMIQLGRTHNYNMKTYINHWWVIVNDYGFWNSNYIKINICWLDKELNIIRVLWKRACVPVKKGERYIIITGFEVFNLTDIIIFTINKIFGTFVWIKHEMIEFIKPMRLLFHNDKFIPNLNKKLKYLTFFLQKMFLYKHKQWFSFRSFKGHT